METRINDFKYDLIGLYSIDAYSFLKKISRRSKYRIIDLNKVKFKYQSIKSEINYYYNKNNRIGFTDKKRLETIFSILDLDKSIIDRRISFLSLSEKYILFIALNVLVDREIYLFDNIFKYLDKNNIKNVLNLMKFLKQEDKIIFINDDNINNIYMYLDKMYIIDNDNIINGTTKDLLTNKDILEKYNIPMPDLVAITYYAKKDYNVKLFYHKDVRDIMKDIYKHV